MVVTIGKYVTPNHMDINGNGIEPDFSRFPGMLVYYMYNFYSLIIPAANFFFFKQTALNEVSNYLSRCQMQRVG